MPSKRYLDLTKLAREKGHQRFIKDTPEKKARRLAKAGKDTIYFGEIYLPHYLSKPSPPFHREIIDMVKRFLRLAIGAPREHAKSTLLSLLYPLHCICFRTKKFIVLGSDTATQAESFLDDIRIELEENKKITEDFGCLIGKRKWTGSKFVTSTGITVVAKGTGSQTRGLRIRQFRPDLIVWDDPENDEQVESKEQRKKTRKWFFKSLSNCLSVDGQMIIPGTILHHDCLLANLVKNEAYIHKIYRAYDENGEPIWTQMWSKERLEEKRKEIGSVAFNTEFMNNPIDPETMIFNPEWFVYYEPEDISGIPMDIYGALDPSLGRTEISDYRALITIGISRLDGKIYVLDADIKRETPRQQLDTMCEKFFQYNYLLLGIETVAFQQVIKDWMDEISREKRIYLPTVEVKHTSDKVMRITRLSPLIQRGDILFRRDQTLLLQQLQDFPRGDYVDGPDSLEMAVDVARNRAAQFVLINEPAEGYEGRFYI